MSSSDCGSFAGKAPTVGVLVSLGRELVSGQGKLLLLMACDTEGHAASLAGLGLGLGGGNTLGTLDMEEL